MPKLPQKQRHRPVCRRSPALEARYIDPKAYLASLPPEEVIYIPDCVLRLSLSPGAKLLLCMLYHHGGEGSQCCRTLDALARDLGSTRRQITRAMRELTMAGLIRTTRRQRQSAVRTFIFTQELQTAIDQGPLW